MARKDYNLTRVQETYEFTEEQKAAAIESFGFAFDVPIFVCPTCRRGIAGGGFRAGDETYCCTRCAEDAGVLERHADRGART